MRTRFCSAQHSAAWLTAQLLSASGSACRLNSGASGLFGSKCRPHLVQQLRPAERVECRTVRVSLRLSLRRSVHLSRQFLLVTPPCSPESPLLFSLSLRPSAVTIVLARHPARRKSSRKASLCPIPLLLSCALLLPPPSLWALVFLSHRLFPGSRLHHLQGSSPVGAQSSPAA
jgi:hypothetical protein